MTEQLTSALLGNTTWDNSFWTSPTGLFVLITIFVCSVGNIMAHWIKDSPIDRIFYTVCALTCLAVGLHLRSGTEAQNGIKTLIIAVAAHFLITFVTRSLHYLRTRTTQKVNLGGH